MKLAVKKALITEGNGGIGLATGRLFISEGAEVAISGRGRLLATVPGIGIMGASAIAATVVDPSLFRSGQSSPPG
jgi:NAD(P)-dependent dehydrogenase (short-subunit alcohol dehydrogenase family)